MNIKRLQRLIDKAFEREEKAKIDTRATIRQLVFFLFLDYNLDSQFVYDRQQAQTQRNEAIIITSLIQEN